MEISIWEAHAAECYGLEPVEPRCMLAPSF